MFKKQACELLYKACKETSARAVFIKVIYFVGYYFQSGNKLLDAHFISISFLFQSFFIVEWKSGVFKLALTTMISLVYPHIDNTRARTQFSLDSGIILFCPAKLIDPQ